MAELVKFQQKTDSQIDATPITDGLLMFSTTTGSGRIAMDYGGARNEMGGTEITVDSTLSLVSKNPVQNKVITAETTDIRNDMENGLTEIENTYTQSFPSCETYSPTGTYAINDYVIYSDALYRCIVAITVGEAWNSAHWASINSTNIGIIYNTTDSSFYGRSGADSVLKKLNKTIHKYTFLSAEELRGARTVPFNIKSIPNYKLLTSSQMSAGFTYVTHIPPVSSYSYSVSVGVSSMSYNSGTGVASVVVTSIEQTVQPTYQLKLNVFVSE